MFVEIIKLIRPHQYLKNLFIFVPLFFSLKITDVDLLINAFFAFIAFNIAASGIYVLNDYKDIEFDRKHPKKKFRPLASGRVSKNIAKLLIWVGITTGLMIMFLISKTATIVLGIYVVLNIAYSFYLKHIAIIDVSIISIGFVIRLFIGSIVTNIELSIWIVVITFLLALFLALAKRRDDIIIFNNTGEKLRKVIDGYNLQFLNITMSIMGSVIIVAYILWTIDATSKFRSNYLYLSAFWVIIGIMRYLQISFVYENSGSPTKIILKDKFLQIVLIGWILTFIWILYL